jgi:uncharacterized membrane protein YebE (DUF533 family)
MMKDRIDLLADILMAAAYSDGHLEGIEKATVTRLLRETLGAPTLPMDLSFRINDFSMAEFKLPETAAAFAKDPPETKRALLQLVAAVHASDSEHDFEEDAFLRQLAGALGMPAEAYADLVIHILEKVDLVDSLARVRAVG